MVRVLALDLATSAGWAADPTDRTTERPDLGTLMVGSDDGYFGKSFAIYERRLRELLQRYRPEVIAYEAPIDRRINGLTVNMKLLGLVAVTQLVGFKQGLRLMPCNILQVRRHFCGYGRAKKEDVQWQCKVLRWDAANGDEADAAAVWAYAHGYLQAQEARKTA